MVSAAASLCDQIIETAAQMVLECPFSRSIWAAFQRDRPKMVSAANQSNSIKGWWARLLKLRNRKKNLDIVMASMVVWHIWKERNQRVFENCSSLTEYAVSFIRSECALLREAGWE